MYIVRIFIATALLFFSIHSSHATPKNIIIIRHGDKFPPVTCLSLQGLERSAALAYYFSENAIYNTPRISHIFACYKHKNNKPYLRAKQTCAPIAERLKVPLNTDYKVEETKEIARHILTNPQYNEGTVLICWEHANIAPLVIALGGDDPGVWGEDIFDQVYMLTYEEAPKPKFQKFLQQLMFGDRKTFEDKPTPLPPIPLPCTEVK